MRTPGQRAYEAFIAALPICADGTPRKQWHEHSTFYRALWEQYHYERVEYRDGLCALNDKRRLAERTTDQQSGGE